MTDHSNAGGYVDSLIKIFALRLPADFLQSIVKRVSRCGDILYGFEDSSLKSALKNKVLRFFIEGKLSVGLRFLKRIYFETYRKTVGDDWTLGPRDFSSFPKDVPVPFTEVMDTWATLFTERCGLPAPPVSMLSRQSLPAPPNYFDFLAAGVPSLRDSEVLRRYPPPGISNGSGNYRGKGLGHPAPQARTQKADGRRGSEADSAKSPTNARQLVPARRPPRRRPARLLRSVRVEFPFREPGLVVDLGKIKRDYYS